MSDIQISDVTNATATVAGTGIFDVLIDQVEIRLDAQYLKQRISGTDYATVYLGAMTAVLQQSIAFALQQEEAGLNADKVTEEINTTIGATAKMYAEIALLDQKQITELAQTTDPTGGLAKAQFDKIGSEKLLLDEKTTTETGQTTDMTTGLIGAQQALFAAQTSGFAGKHENELLKIYLDTWAVVYSINDGDLAGTEFGIPSFILQASPTVTLPPIIDEQATESSGIYSP